MGRPLNKRLFGTPSSSTNTIKVQFHNGTSSVKGYIVKQKGAKWFQCKDANGNVAVCRIVDKASADLQAGEMTITIKYDDLQVDQVTKISGRNVTVRDHQEHWTFSTSTTDGYVQIEEAGSSSTLSGATDLELDDDPNGDYPVPGSGTYLSAATAFTGMSYSLQGTAAAVTGGVDTVSNSADGLFRSKYAGHFNDSLGGLPTNWDMTFFQTTPLVRTIADTKVSWGNQTDTAQQENFSMEWKGYIQVPATGTYNFYCHVDDDCAVWIGNNSQDANISNANYDMQGSNQSMPGSSIVNTNSRTMTAGKWYPIRIWMTEYSGGSKFQLFAIKSTGETYNGDMAVSGGLKFAYNTVTGGY